jgi:hypothetical protein
MSGRLLEGPTMAGRTSDWKGELQSFLETVFGIAYVSRPIGPSISRAFSRGRSGLSNGDGDQCNHFITAGIWDAKPGETELLVQADKLVGGSDAVFGY